MAAGQSPPGRPGITIKPLKADKDVAGWGKRYWLKKDDSKYLFKHKYTYVYHISNDNSSYKI